MRSSYHSSLFRDGSIGHIFHSKLEGLNAAIDRESENYILNVNESEYAQHLENQFQIEKPVIHFDQLQADSYEGEVPAEYFPFSFAVNKGETYKREIFQLFIPCSGNTSLLSFSPASSLLYGSNNFILQSNAVVTEIINFNFSAQEIKQKVDYEIESIRPTYTNLVSDIDGYNNSLSTKVIQRITERKNKILAKQDMLFSLGIPVRKKEGTPTTFSVPKPELRKKIILKPVVYDKEFKAEPTLDDSTYKEILKLINDVGKNFERMPSLYKGKREEDLRDHILMTLDPNFQMGSASGETFNKSGKTDIQLRYDSSVVFVAECKYWGGEKQLLATISQLLGYLTWRDTKTSCIVFVQQKSFWSILDKIQGAVEGHENYLGFVEKSDENWFNFRFHLNGDKNREVKLAVQLFHLPEND
jgi:hypothetical protein